ncbi:cyclopropane-fatty-acyl-phospholipid synthase [Pseudomonas sp. TCU-HL1]|nr:cyclopropane-fatty-acyl-phospholipid synthase [Pseudomonas sp. TCU-HL1]
MQPKGKIGRADMALNLIDKLYGIERDHKDGSETERRQARRSVDFIQRYIFPDGALPSLTTMLQTASAETQLNLLHMEDFGPHYARTLRLWHDNLRQRSQRLRQKNGRPQTRQTLLGSSVFFTGPPPYPAAPTVARRATRLPRGALHPYSANCDKPWPGAGFPPGDRGGA